MEELLALKISLLEDKVDLFNMTGELLADIITGEVEVNKTLAYINNEIAPLVDRVDSSIDQVEKLIKIQNVLNGK